ncbi:MAG: ribonuclease P [Hadesarchaea archaeon]|nr:ribonuclease P [Hadesarchaea archaeon]
MPRWEGKSRADDRVIAAERIERLFELAERVFDGRPALADRYVQLAWRLATRYNLRMPAYLKRKFCRKCLSFLRPGVSCRVRTRSRPSPSVVITCLRCGHHMRVPYRRKGIEKR